MKTELQEIADKLADTYGNDRHFEIIKAEKSGNYWNLTIESVNDEGADDETDKEIKSARGFCKRRKRKTPQRAGLFFSYNTYQRL